MRKIILFALSAVLCSCASKEVSSPTPSATTKKTEAPRSTAPVSSADENIDFLGLQHSLGLDRSDDELGYREKGFSTCEAGYGYSSSGNCRRLSFVVLNLRLLCRPTEGTDSTILTAADLTPVGGRDVTWHFKGTKGVVRTDGLGFFQIRTALASSPRSERLRLVVGDDFLVMRAGEMGRLVTPKSWCP